MKLASRVEKEIFTALNQIRKDPRSFIPLIDNSLRNFKHRKSLTIKRFGLPDLITQEGIKPYLSARFSLLQQSPLPALLWSDSLALTAQDHCTLTNSISLYAKITGPSQILSQKFSGAIISLFVGDGDYEREYR